MKTCTIPSCDRRHSTNGLCGAHLYRQRRGLDMDAPFLERTTPTGEQCIEDSCTDLGKVKGRCVRHNTVHWGQENSVRKIESNRVWYLKNREHKLAQNAEWARTTGAESRRQSSRKRRVMKMDVFTDGTIEKYLDRDSVIHCQYCGVKLDHSPLKSGEYRENEPTLEHVVCLNSGGEHSIGNSLIICRRENSSKSDKPLHEWLLETRKRGDEIRVHGEHGEYNSVLDTTLAMMAWRQTMMNGLRRAGIEL